MAIHTLPANTMTQAFAAALGKPTNVFEFDLVDQLKAITSQDFGNRILNKVAFACDAYINIAIQRGLSAMRMDKEQEGAAPWDSYQTFLNYAAGVAASEEVMAEAGMDVLPLREQLQALFNMRTACHDTLVNRRYVYGKSKAGVAIMEPPHIADFLANPRMRRDDPDTVRKLNDTFKAQAMDDDGVIDVELEQELAKSYHEKDAYAKAEALKWDRQRGQLAASFWHAFNLKEYAPVRIHQEAPVHALRVDDSTVKLDAQEVVSRSMGMTGEVSPVDPFGDLTAEVQYKLLHGSLRYVSSALVEGAKDKKVDYAEHAKWRVESRPLVKAIKAALEHDKFAACGA